MFEQRKSPSKIYRVLSHVPSRKINRNGEARPHITELRKKDKLIEEAYNFLTFLPFGNTVILRSCDLQKKKMQKKSADLQNLFKVDRSTYDRDLLTCSH